MKPRFIPLQIAVFLTINIGCTTQNIYDAGQGWKREQCRKMADQIDNRNCMDQTNKPYLDYKLETESANKK